MDSGFWILDSGFWILGLRENGCEIKLLSQHFFESSFHPMNRVKSSFCNF
jgi:hypothetical protein